MSPHTYDHLIFDKGAKTIQWKKIQPSQQMELGKLSVSMQKNAINPFLSFLYKTQVPVDNAPPHKTRYTETNRRENEEKP